MLPLIGGTVAVSDTLFTLELANTVMRQMNGGQLLTAGISVTVLSNVDGTAAHRLPPPLSVTSEAPLLTCVTSHTHTHRQTDSGPVTVW